eukprot:CAMPEP_0197726602 /NCGR_PEP_ID=MMETSP1434-20131217/16391_1 /TAXON_ID=265543 /ORGANISM="Minutocellus polymorphus, Strain CCMP3303" /LENGTH=35 /DNA_ID= /DNA_START= /DNA_END= /DNA_ORIENTATION=
MNEMNDDDTSGNHPTSEVTNAEKVMVSRNRMVAAR